MPKIQADEPESLSELLTSVEAYQAEREVVWYRGVNNVAHDLTPSIIRLTKKPTEKEVVELESAIFSAFSQRSPPFVEKDFPTSWRTLFFMQHYGIPTRLLDWSESPFVALYFALSNVERTNAGVPKKDVAVWMCDPIGWNRGALSHISYQGGILDEQCEEVKSYEPSVKHDHRWTMPVMLHGTHNSARIVAQRGVFALFGKGLKSMEDVSKSDAFADDVLRKAIIRKDRVDAFLNSLFQKGITESVIYPDLQGLALEIRRKFGYL
ncbi:FRG domain-containing protein [Aurantiacibacter sp. MUD61]|uniref:FRG domain-containing protein n=1 Tax=Aurantiacibacter sp. MUD61 TaxID=3009083 RepID=UPI0022F10959|nr:FRG domain-containing protein [Aurantiacibacter sp. MUD61]